MKHLILCADGTGNLGGTTPDSNVYRTYHLVDRADPTTPQLTYYDNGVGTASNTYWRAFTGAFGFGFKRNVLELYEYVARNYDPGDRVFLFGFSRGAAEVRALSGMIASTGLVDGRNLDKKSLDKKIEAAYRHYKKKRSGLLFSSHGAIDLTFIGVWDTVSALGFPKYWRIAGILSPILNGLFHGLDWLCDITIFAHNFYNYELTDNVKHAYQALAIDDERLSFEPKVWKEPPTSKTTVEQVWFAGAHSNVGGGYGRAGLSHIALEWMLSKAVAVGLKLKAGSMEEVRAKAHAHGRLYNERNGLGVFYRYYPRVIAELCKNKLPETDTVKIHRSVFERMARFTGHYAPGHLPSQFNLVEADSSSKTVTIKNPQWAPLQKRLQGWTLARSWLYGLFLDVSIALVFFAWWLWVFHPELAKVTHEASSWAGDVLIFVARFLKYVLPEMFDNLINLVFVQQPLYFGAGLLIIGGLFKLRAWVRGKYHKVCYDLREILLTETEAKSPRPKHTLNVEVTGQEKARVSSS